MGSINRYLVKYGRGALTGDPAAITMLIIVGAIVAGAHVVDKIKKSTANAQPTNENR
jgi:hypothetical protein